MYFITADPPSITEFLEGSLDYPSAVVANQTDKGFELPCKASGTKPLTWTWIVGTEQKSKNLTIDGTVFKVKQDGTLVGRLLTPKHSNLYQCQVSNKQGLVFSRKIKVKVSGKLNSLVITLVLPYPRKHNQSKSSHKILSCYVIVMEYPTLPGGIFML